MVVTLVALALLGLCVGSFINALVWRVREQELGKQGISILKGRSQCPHCNHVLAGKDLIPVFSWLALRGKCRYCGHNISKQYPIVELATSALFLLSYSFWPNGIYGVGDWLIFGTWLLCLVGLIALLVFDYKWMLLPNRIVYPTMALALSGRLIYILVFSADVAHDLLLLALSIVVASGIFWLIFVFSKGKWIGYGDVRLGIVLGTLLATPKLAFLMIFVASVLGTIYSLPSILSRKRTISSRIPFGPFLIAATIIVMLFGNRFIDWYTGLLS